MLSLVWFACGTPEVLTDPPSPTFPGRAHPVDVHGQLSVSGAHIVSEHGHPVQLRGVSTQWLNWEQRYSTSPDTMAWLRDDWGVDVIRVANGVEHPTGYAANVEARRAMVDRIVGNAIDAGLYVIVDWHTHRIDFRPLALEFFEHVAVRWGDEPNVLYETFNEPAGLDWEEDLRPYHQAVIARIRTHDPDNIVIAGTPQFDQRPDRALAAPLDDPNVAYALHFYACSHQAGIRTHGQAVLDAGRALFVSEWGSMHFEGGLLLPVMCPDATQDWHQWMATHHVGGTAWKLSSDYDLAGMLKPTAPIGGGWSDRHLGRHGQLVRAWTRAGVTASESSPVR